MKSENLNFLEPSGPLQFCNGTDLPFTYVDQFPIKNKVYFGRYNNDIDNDNDNEQ